MRSDRPESAVRPADAVPPRLLDHATAIARIYTRAFLSQGVGIVGLAWCLATNLPWAALGLALLVGIDQAVFLRGRQPIEGAPRLQAGLDAWCLAVSAADLLILFAALFRAMGLHEIGGGAIADPSSCFAFALATLVHLNLGIVPVTAMGRLLASLLALLGCVALLGAVAALLRGLRPRAPGITAR